MTIGRTAAGLSVLLSLMLASTTSIAQSVDVDALAGVYKYSFENGNVDGDTYYTENILEIVKLSPSSAYVRMHLAFFNAHTCNLWGVADIEGDALVYRGRETYQGKPCVLTLSISDGRISFADEGGACRLYSCGARGMFDGIGFDLRSRRRIRYMERLLASPQYAEAIAEHAIAPPVSPGAPSAPQTQ